MALTPRCYITFAAGTGSTVTPALTGWTNAGLGISGTAPVSGDIVLIVSGVNNNSPRTFTQTAGTGTWTIQGPDNQLTTVGGLSLGLNSGVPWRIFDGTETAPTFTWSNGGRNTWTAVAFAPGTGTTGKALFGSSLKLNAGQPGYPGTDGEALNWANAQQLDTYVFGSTATKWSQQLQKLYLSIGQLPTNAYTNWPDLNAFVNTHGGQVLISLRPRWTTKTRSPALNLTTESNNFVTTIKDIDSKIPGKWKATIWQEANQPPFAFGGANWEFGSVAGYTGANGSAADYKAYFAHYANLIRTNTPSVPIVYDPEVATGNNNGGSGNQAGAVAYCPDAQWVDEIYVDYYCTSFNGGQRLDSIASLANSLNVPFGIGEWGLAASNVNVTQSQWDSSADYTSTFPSTTTSYVGYLTNLFSNRQTAGSSNGWVIYFAYNGPANEIGGSPPGNLNGNGIVSGDVKIPGIKYFRTAVGS